MALSSAEIRHEGYHLAIDMLNSILVALDPNAEVRIDPHKYFFTQPSVDPEVTRHAVLVVCADLLLASFMNLRPSEGASWEGYFKNALSGISGLLDEYGPIDGPHSLDEHRSEPPT
jgi:hypothetical protein